MNAVLRIGLAALLLAGNVSTVYAADRHKAKPYRSVAGEQKLSYSPNKDDPAPSPVRHNNPKLYYPALSQQTPSYSPSDNSTKAFFDNLAEWSN